jgi:hypothetical protein
MATLYLLTITACITALGVVFHSDAAVLVGAMLSLFFSWLYFIDDGMER